MADSLDPFALNIRGVTDLIENDTNKVAAGGSTSSEGVNDVAYDALKLDMSDEELLKLRDEWEKRYAPYETGIKKIAERNLESYLGKRKDGQWLVDDGPLAANLQFESEETFLAAALAKNPEPVIYADNTPEGNAIANSVKTMVRFHADQLVLRQKFALMVRQWSIYHLAVLKHGWKSLKDAQGREIGDVSVENRKIQDFIFDPEGYVDAYGDFKGYLGERIKKSAGELIKLFPNSKEYITEMCGADMNAECTYTEWWTDEFCFTTFKEKVLDKHKNEYFKYPEPVTDENGTVLTDDAGEPIFSEPRNHFASPKKPYTFLSVFSLQTQPHDLTGLIEQNIANQRKISKRTEQIDVNADNSNNGYAYSGENFNEEEAKQASVARKNGDPIIVPPGGPIERAIYPLPAQELPAAFFNDLETTKNDLRTSWGIQGIIAEPHDEDQTARGMILNQSHDTTRIGGGIGDKIEQVADNVFNWLVQLYYVFYDEKHFGVIMGNAKAVEFVTLSNADLDRQLIVSVSPNSMRPKDEITQMNLAQALFDKGAIGPKTLLTMLDFPNAEDAAADGLLYRNDPLAYMNLNFPDLVQRLQMAQQQQAMAQPLSGETPPEGASPESVTEPEQGISRDPSSAALSQVPLPSIPA